ncbi:MAG: hypothetical protein KAG94_04900 [Clostridiales bacterium]|nr:hypothetical protein [Clostridiales bacterium]
MKILVNIALKGNIVNDWFLEDYNKLTAFLKSHHIDGVEGILYNPGKINKIPLNLVKGLHLIYWPMWLDLWTNNQSKLMSEFINIKNIKNYYGFTDKEGFIHKYTQEFLVAKELSCEYMVFHVSQISIEETYSLNFTYDDLFVLDETAKLVNKVFIGDGPMLLFENLWSPGLNFLDWKKAIYFLEKIDYKNKGFILDISHLLLTNRSISSYNDAIDYLLYILNVNKEILPYIKGIHLNKPSFLPYIREDHKIKAKTSLSKQDFMEKLIDVYNHISKIDTHTPFIDKRINQIIDLINPEWIVYEFLPKDLSNWATMLNEQNSVIKR